MLSYFFSVAQIDHWETVVDQSLTWRYFIGDTEPSVGWMNYGFSDNSWPTGVSGFGFGDGDDATIIPDYTPAVYIRGHFNIIDSAAIISAVLHIDYDDGFIAYLNGVEIARSANIGMPGTLVPYNQYATPDHEAEMYQGGLPEIYMIHPSLLQQHLKQGSNILAIQVNNYGAWSSDLSLIPFFSVGIANSGNYYNPLPTWFWVETPFLSSNLPLVQINTFGYPINDEERILCSIGIIDNGFGNRNYITDTPNVYNGKAGIKIRGSSSAYYFPQKSYGFELWDNDSNDFEAPIFGMPAESDWILYGSYSDKTMLRNNIIYNIGRRMGHWTTHTKFVEVILNNQYIGVYEVMEKIKRGSGRVDISKLKTCDTTGLDITGGYILKVDRQDDDEAAWISPYRNVKIVVHYPKIDSLQPAQLDYISNKISNFEHAMYSSYYKDPVIGYRNWIDLQSMVDYVLCTEVTNNIDAFSLSTFFYKDRDDKDSTLHFGPIWDFNLGFGNADYAQGWRTDNWRYVYKEQSGAAPKWWHNVWNDPYFLSALKARWVEIRQSYLHTDSVLQHINAQVLLLSEARERHFEKWPILGTYTWPNYYIGDTYDDEILWLKNWIINRLGWLDINLPQYYVMPKQQLIYINATAGSTAYLLINANTNWQVTSNATWISLACNSGTGIGSVAITAVANPFTYIRTGILTLTSTSIPGLTIYITVKQLPCVVGLEENTPPEVMIYPNPVVDALYIQGLPENCSVVISNITGQAIAEYTNVNGFIDLSTLSHGVYVLSYSLRGNKYCKKIVKL